MKEEEEVTHTDTPVEFKKLSLDDPAAIDRGTEAEAFATTPDGQPEAEVESQDQSTWSVSLGRLSNDPTYGYKWWG